MKNYILYSIGMICTAFCMNTPRIIMIKLTVPPTQDRKERVMQTFGHGGLVLTRLLGIAANSQLLKPNELQPVVIRHNTLRIFEQLEDSVPGNPWLLLPKLTRQRKQRVAKRELDPTTNLVELTLNRQSWTMRLKQAQMPWPTDTVNFSNYLPSTIGPNHDVTINGLPIARTHTKSIRALKGYLVITIGHGAEKKTMVFRAESQIDKLRRLLGIVANQPPAVRAYYDQYPRELWDQSTAARVMLLQGSNGSYTFQEE